MYAYGLLAKNNFVERNALELKGSTVGSTGPMVMKAVKEASGGCLFLDEAYALVDSSNPSGGHSDVYSQDAIRTLLTEVENNRGKMMFVLAGYKDKMAVLMRADPGLPSRFPKTLHLKDYSTTELAQICETKAKNKFCSKFEPGLLAKLAKHIGDFYAYEIPEQNGRLAANLTEAAIEKQMDRLGRAWEAELKLRESGGTAIQRLSTAALVKDTGLLIDTDYGILSHPKLGDAEEKAKIEAEVQNDLIGMQAAKDFFAETKKIVQFMENGGNPKILHTSLNMIVTGNPGTSLAHRARHRWSVAGVTSLTALAQEPARQQSYGSSHDI